MILQRASLESLRWFLRLRSCWRFLGDKNSFFANAMVHADIKLIKMEAEAAMR